MHTQELDDPILKANRRSALARRLILHGVRTQLVTRLTGLSPGRLLTVRRRLMVPAASRHRGPVGHSRRRFLRSDRGRNEGAGIAAILSVLTAEQSATTHLSSNAALDLGERLCETYEAFRACFPQTEIQLEELVVLRSTLSKHRVIGMDRCCRCGCLILIDLRRSDRTCAHCKASD